MFGRGSLVIKKHSISTVLFPENLLLFRIIRIHHGLSRITSYGAQKGIVAIGRRF